MHQKGVSMDALRYSWDKKKKKREWKSKGERWKKEKGVGCFQEKVFKYLFSNFGFKMTFLLDYTINRKYKKKIEKKI